MKVKRILSIILTVFLFLTANIGILEVYAENGNNIEENEGNLPPF